MNLAHLLQRIARMDPQRPAIYSGSRQLATYAQWAARSARLARRLRGVGLQPGDRVALFMHNHPRYLEVMFGAWWAGLAVVPINAKLHLREAQWIVDNAQTRWVFVTSDIAPADAAAFAGVDGVIDVDCPACDGWLPDGDGDETAVEVPIADRAPDDLAWLFYTSGTTGRPKGVMLSHRNLMTMGLGYFNDVDPIASQDVIAYAAPMSHGAGIYAIPHLMAGARHAVPASGGFDPAELFALGRDIGALSLFAAPTIVKRLVDHAQASGETPESCAARFLGSEPKFAQPKAGPSGVTQSVTAKLVSDPNNLAARPCMPPILSAPCGSWGRALFRFTARVKAPWSAPPCHALISCTPGTRSTRPVLLPWAWRKHPCKSA